ncbi:protein inscuteable homolog [Caerostris extrusa]|uniref:Protein inscuteable homolog n=1 Tax=Caerostris extrusa TaxID=172846 RepID=A0AAV4N1K8_CAEEX|nr:protein inscuteable homolog [Caerostris extrusa]
MLCKQKELFKEEWIPNALAVGNAQESSEKIWEIGSTIQQHVAEMMECLKSEKSAPVPLSLKVAQFCASIIELLKMTNSIKQSSQAGSKNKEGMLSALETVNKSNDKDWRNKVKAELECLQKVAQVLVQQLLLTELHVIVDCVERAENINNLKRSVFAVILLGRIHPTFCEIMTKLGAVRSLLSICVESKWREMHPCGLRALTVLSCVPTAIRSFEESGGVDCVCDLLCDKDSQEGSRSEAAGLIAQITAPWTEGSGYVLKSVNTNSDRLISSLAEDERMQGVGNTDHCLSKQGSRIVSFIKDQVATVLANMAAKEEYRDDLSSGGSLVLLLCFLQLRPSSVHGTPQLAACERIQQKAAIALARLCTNPDTSNTVAEMQGIQRLVKLCKDKKERNDSDSVLVACLAALRKIAAVREKEEFIKLGAQELIEPRLWDAFLAHSSKRESYV